MSVLTCNPIPSSAASERWLIYSYFSNIDGMACAQHLDDRIPHFQRLGIEPILITGICGPRWQGFAHARVPCIAPSGIRFESRHWLRGIIRASWLRKITGFLILLPLLPFYLLEKLLLNLDSQWSWFVLAAVRGRRLCRKYRPAIIYSTGGPASTHLAAALVSRWTGIPWVAEFQDPVVYPGLMRSGRAIRLYQWLERLVARRADRVVFLTETASQRFSQRTGVDGNCCAIYPGADLEKISRPRYEKGEVCRFSHFGTLAGSRNLKGFLEALSEVLKGHPSWRGKIEIHLYGHMDGPMRELVRQFPHFGVICDHGRRPRREILIAMAQSDVLLLVQNSEPISEETIPSKLYEYLLAARPVFALIYRNQELERLLQKQEQLASEIGDIAKIQQSIVQVMEYWQDGFIGWQPPASRFTAQAAVERLIKGARQISSIRR